MSHDLIVASVSSLSNFEADQSNDRNVEDRKADKKNPRAPAATADGGGQPHAKRSTSGSFRERHEARDRTQSQPAEERSNLCIPLAMRWKVSRSGEGLQLLSTKNKGSSEYIISDACVKFGELPSSPQIFQKC